MKRFECEFGNPRTGKCRTVIVELDANELAAVAEVRKTKGAETAEVYGEVYALRHAYREVPDGFVHMQDGIKILDRVH